MARCMYCECDLTDETILPSIGDDPAWQALAREHAPDCEWILTRAHRIADARLIAAAPGLLNACQVALASMMELADNAGDVEEWNEQGHAHDAAEILRAAIKQATKSE